MIRHVIGLDSLLLDRGCPDRGAPYVAEVEAPGGGDPATSGRRARMRPAEPAIYLEAATQTGVSVFVTHGLSDRVVPLDHAVRTFNALAAPQDALGDDVVTATTRNQLRPARADKSTVETGSGLSTRPRSWRGVRASPAGAVRGGHDIAYHPGLRWIADLAGRRASPPPGGRHPYWAIGTEALLVRARSASDSRRNAVHVGRSRGGSTSLTTCNSR